MAAVAGRALVLRSEDDVAVALTDIAALASVQLGGAASGTVVATEPIARGHKLALHDVRDGAPVRKYGVAIGHATCAIACGAHVHVHNVESDRLRGDA